jgi:hypothetical protein
MNSRTVLVGLFGLALFVVGIIQHIPLAVFFGFLGFFTAVDVWGFGYLLGHETGNPKDGKVVHVYHAILGLFQIGSMYFVNLFLGLSTVIACTVAWYLLLCDLLYYWMTLHKLDNFTWWNYSPVVFLFQRILKQDAAPAWAVRVSAIAGLLIGLWILS